MRTECCSLSLLCYGAMLAACHVTGIEITPKVRLSCLKRNDSTGTAKAQIRNAPE